MTQIAQRQSGERIRYQLEGWKKFESQNLKGFCDRTHEFCRLSVKRAGDRPDNIVKIC
ncbi:MULTISPECIES: hypothetical protein [unclassified Microcoleus]|uniref:hypothetical protein n=1 Tax=unclassified Microcoleus TaxID=2642155 RepID=UPI0025DE9B57|nr:MULTISPECIES: hypothetical protein [unclassified Microcoleus]